MATVESMAWTSRNYNFDDAKFVLRKFFKEGMTFATLPESHNDPGQGWFYDDDSLKRWMDQGGFKTIEAYYDAWNEMNSVDDEDEVSGERCH